MVKGGAKCSVPRVLCGNGHDADTFRDIFMLDVKGFQTRPRGRQGTKSARNGHSLQAEPLSEFEGIALATSHQQCCLIHGTPQICWTSSTECVRAPMGHKGVVL